MSKLDIRVGKIIKIVPNEQGDKLYNEEIDIGNGEIRTIASGLRDFVKIEDLKDSFVVVICNLKARNLKGWKSHGMILCAETKDQKIVEPLRPPQGSNPGDLVFIGDLPREPASDKKCPWEKVCNDLFVNDKKIATYKDELVWKTDKGEIMATTITDGVIR
jgi:methionine--tRNA ligase beta chain